MTDGCDEQKRAFQERLARLGCPETAPLGMTEHTPEVDANGLIHAQHAEYVEPSRFSQIMTNALYPLGIFGAFLIGLIAVFLGRWVRFQIMGVDNPDMDPDMQMIMDGVLAFLLGFILRHFFDLEGKEYIVAKTNGIIVMVVGMHNLVWLWPNAFAHMFSVEWVNAVMWMTEPRTILFRGVLIPF